MIARVVIDFLQSNLVIQIETMNECCCLNYEIFCSISLLGQSEQKRWMAIIKEAVNCLLFYVLNNCADIASLLIKSFLIKHSCGSHRQIIFLLISHPPPSSTFLTYLSMSAVVSLPSNTFSVIVCFVCGGCHNARIILLWLLDVISMTQWRAVKY